MAQRNAMRTLAAVALIQVVAAQGGDDCSAPTVISGTGVFSVDLSSASTSLGAPCDSLEQDVFFEWTPDEGGDYRFKMTNPLVYVAFHPTIQVAVGGDCNSTCLAGPFGRYIALSNIVANQPYLLRISKTDPAGPFTTGWLEIVKDLPIPTGVHPCDAARVISGTGMFRWAIQPGDPSSTITRTGLPTASPWSEYYSDPADAACGSGTITTNGTFLNWTAPADGTYSFLAASGQIDIGDYEDLLIGESNTAAMSIFRGVDCGDLTCVGTSSDIDPFIGLFWAQLLDVQASAGEAFTIQLSDNTPTVASRSRLFINGVTAPCASSENFQVSCTPPNSHHDGGQVGLSGSFTDCSGGGLHLEAFQGPAGEFGYFLMGSGASQNILAFEGMLCLDSPVGRYNANLANNIGVPAMNSIGMFHPDSRRFMNVAGTSTSGTGFDVPLTLPNPPGPGQILPGDTWYFQLWYRDESALGQNSSNLSAALGVTFP